MLSKILFFTFYSCLSVSQSVCLFVWVAAGKHSSGVDDKENVKFKSAIRCIKRNEQRMQANSLAKKLQHNNMSEFWKDINLFNHSKSLMPASIDGITGDKNIAELWKNLHCILCVNNERFNVANIGNNGMFVRPDEVCLAIKKTLSNKACVPDQLSAST